MTFSVIIPVYNIAPYLERAVRSVQAQDYADCEIVLVDDGSADGSGAICDRLAAEDARIKVVHQPNGGVVAARQSGFAASSGDWILFLDGDDEQMPGLFAALVPILEQENPDMVQFGYLMGIEGQPFDEHHLMIPDGVYQVSDLIRRSKKTPMEVTEMCLWNKVYRRSICRLAFDDVGDVRIKHSEDGLFAFAAYLHAKSFYSLQWPGVKYCLREGSAVHKFNAELADEKVIFVDRVVALFLRSNYCSAELLEKMRAYHAYESMVFIFYCLLRWKGSARQVCALMESLDKTALPRAAIPELTTVRRRLMAFLLRHPSLYLPYRCLSKLKRAI